MIRSSSPLEKVEIMDNHMKNHILGLKRQERLAAVRKVLQSQQPLMLELVAERQRLLWETLSNDLFIEPVTITDSTALGNQKKHSASDESDLQATIQSTVSIASASHARKASIWGEYFIREYATPAQISPRDTRQSLPRSLKSLLSTSPAIPLSHTLFGDYTAFLPEYAPGTGVGDRFMILSVTRAEKTFVEYRAHALYPFSGIYDLTAIRHPQDYTKITHDDSIQSIQEMVHECCNAGYSMMDDFSKLLQQMIDANELKINRVKKNKKMIDAQRKYIIKLIKKRQASKTYLRTFSHDGLIWIVQVPDSSNDEIG